MHDPWPEREPIFGALSFKELSLARKAFRFHEVHFMDAAKEIMLAEEETPETRLRVHALMQRAAAVQKLGHQADVEWGDRLSDGYEPDDDEWAA